MPVDKGGMRISLRDGTRDVSLVQGAAPNHFRLAEKATSGSIHFVDIEPTITKEVEVRVGELDRSTPDATYLLSSQAEAGSHSVPEGWSVRLDIYTLAPVKQGNMPKRGHNPPAPAQQKMERRGHHIFILENVSGFFLTNEENRAFVPGGSSPGSRTNRGRQAPTRPPHGHF